MERLRQSRQTLDSVRFTLGDLRNLIQDIDLKYDQLPLTLIDRHNFITNIQIKRDRVLYPACVFGRDMIFKPRTYYLTIKFEQENDYEQRI